MSTAAEASAIRRAIIALGAVCFSGNCGARAILPVILLLAHDLGEDPTNIALLVSAYALPYALIQPVLGTIGDQFGKIRIMLICAGIMAVSLTASAFVTSFEVMFVLRMIGGAAGGGTFPLSIAILGDRVPMAGRQVAIGRLLTASVSGGLAASAVAGPLADVVGWRGVFLAVAGLAILSFFLLARTFWGAMGGSGGRLDIRAAWRGYMAVFTHPFAKFCYGFVFIEGIFIHGAIPYVPLLLRDIGETRATIAGLVLTGFSLGGVLYSLCVGLLLRFLGQKRMMMGGGMLFAASFIVLSLGVPWPVQMVVLGATGFGFFLIHNSIQTFVTELAPEARGTAVSMHSMFFFIGQALGPIYYGAAFAHFGSVAALLSGAAAIFCIGLAASRVFFR